MISALPLSWTDAEIRGAAMDMIATHDRFAIAKAEAIIRRLKSEGLFSLARTWELIRDKIEELRHKEPNFAPYSEALERNVFLSE